MTRSLHIRDINDVSEVSVSIIVCTFNSAGTIERCMNSILLQSFSDYEILVQDGLSNDGTCEIIRNVTKCRAKILSEYDAGIYDAFNKALSRVMGKYVIFLHSDDFFSSGDTLKNLVTVAFENDADAVFGGVKFITPGGKVTRNWRAFDLSKFKLDFCIVPPHTGCMMKKTSMAHIGAFNTNFRISSDYEYMVRFFKTYWTKSYNINSYVTVMQTGGASTSGWRSEYTKFIEDYRILKKHSRFPMFLVLLKKFTKLHQFFSA